MSISYNVTSMVLGFSIAGLILILVRRNLLHTRHSIWWFLMALASVVFGAFPRIIDRLAVTVGIYYPPILLVVSGLGLILIKILTMDIERSKQEAQLRMLTERLAVLEGENPPNLHPGE